VSETVASQAQLPPGEMMAQDKGRTAASPWAMPRRAWIMVLKRTWSETSADNMGLVAAGVAFYGFLAIVPMMAALVLLYGLVADADTVLRHIEGLARLLPSYAADFIGGQLLEVVTASDGKKGLGLLLALAIAVFGARNGVGAIITALNIAYEETETRSFIRVTLLALTITAGAILLAAVAAVAIAALGYLESLLPTMPDLVIGAGKVLSYAALTLGGAAGAATLYKFGPDRDDPRWIWLTPGSLVAAIGWLMLSLGFGVYLSNFSDYSATYGSLSAIVVMLTWLYLSSYVLLLGAELNSELEHQTARDTTEGVAKPLGARDAWVADHVAGEELSAPVDRARPLSDRPVDASDKQEPVRQEVHRPDEPRAAAGSHGRSMLVGLAAGGIGVALLGRRLLFRRRRLPQPG
jgi:membrane protein